MKTFIVFLALLVVMSSMFVFQNDMNRYTELSEKLKVLAEECANGGALCLDSKALGEGRTVINPDAAREFCEYRCLREVPSGGSLSVSSEVTEEGSTIEVTVTWMGENPFRLSFINPVSSITRSACYRWE